MNSAAAYSPSAGMIGWLSFQLFVSIFSVVNGENVNHLFFLIDNIEQSELTDSIPPSVRRVSLELFDVVAPKGGSFQLRIYKRVELLP